MRTLWVQSKTSKTLIDNQLGIFFRATTSISNHFCCLLIHKLVSVWLGWQDSCHLRRQKNRLFPGANINAWQIGVLQSLLIFFKQLILVEAQKRWRCGITSLEILGDRYFFVVFFAIELDILCRSPGSNPNDCFHLYLGLPVFVHYMVGTDPEALQENPQFLKEESRERSCPRVHLSEFIHQLRQVAISVNFN